MSLGRRQARQHETGGIHKNAVDSSVFADFRENDRVMTVDGYPGIVTAVLDGPYPGTESYDVVLDGGLGGGEYTAGQLSPINGTTASHEREAVGQHMAHDDYPELGSILYDRPPIERLQRYASRGDAAPFEFQHTEHDTGGTKFPTRVDTTAHHPETGEQVGSVRYFPPKRKGGPISIDEVRGDAPGAGSAMLNEIESRHPGSRTVFLHQVKRNNNNPDVTGHAHERAGQPSDWDTHYPNLADTVHRGLALKLPSYSARTVNSSGNTKDEHLAELHRALQESSAGTHWTEDEHAARLFAHNAVSDHRTDIPVVLHAATPARKDIETRQTHLYRGGVFPYGDPHSSENEVPIRKGRDVALTGISWRPDTEHPDADEHGWLHHTYDEPKHHTANQDFHSTPAFEAGHKDAVYLRFGKWRDDERSNNNVTGGHEDGVSVYELNKHGEPMDPDPHMTRGRHEHDDWCDDDCDQDFDSDYGNDTAEEMRGRANRAERNRYSGQDRDHETGHLVKGEMVGIGHDGEPLLQKVRRVGDWINDRHKFIPTAEPHRLAEYDFDHHHGSAGEPATGEPDPEATTSACSYCGSSDLQTAGDNGRNVQVQCLDCGGMMSSNGGQLQPELIGDPSNHPSGAPDLRAQTNGGVPPVRRMNPSDASTTFTAMLRTARSWDDIGEEHPHIYGDPEVHGDAAHGADGEGIGWAANQLAHDRPDDPGAEETGSWDLEFHEEHVDPKHIDYARHGANDSRVRHAHEGYKSNPEAVPPVVLVHRHGVYQVADGHHRAEAAALAGKKVRAYVAYSPHPDEPFSDGDSAPYHGAEPHPGLRHHASLRMQASDEHDYRMMHQAPDADYGAPLHDVENIMPGFYDHPHYYNHGQDHFHDSANKVMKARGNPEHKVRIYRALPAEHAGGGFNTGDWVTTSKDYARLHGRHYNDSKHDMPVISTVVPAKHLHTEGDIHEWAYNGPSTSDASVAFKGGHHQEIRQRADGSIAQVKRKANPSKERENDLKAKGYSFSHYRPTSEDNPDHTVVAYDSDDNWAGHVKARGDGTVHHVEIDPQHEHEPLEAHMRSMIAQDIKKRGSLTIQGAKYQYETTVQGPLGYEDQTHEIEGPLYHGGRANVGPGDHITTGRKPNSWGDDGGKSTHVYFTTDLDTAHAYADQVGPKGRVYEVEPTGEFKHDRNGVDFKTKHPLRVVQEVPRGHTASLKGELDTEGLWHFTAAWSDVREKARRLRAEGQVRITVASSAGIGGEVKGDHNVYETALNFVPGSQKVGYWSCGCKWSAYAWGRSPAYKRFEGRMCSHALAMQFEAQARGMFGQTVTPDAQRPKWLKSHTPVVIQHERDTHNDLTRRAVPPGNMRRTFEGSMTFEAFMREGTNPEPLDLQRMLDRARDEEHAKHMDDGKYAENYHPLAQSDIPAEHMKGWRFQQNLEEAGGASFFDKDDHESRKAFSSAHEPPVNVSTYRHPVSREHLYLDDQGRAWARHNGPRLDAPTDEHKLPRFSHWSGPHKASEVLENHPIWSQYDDQETGQRKWRWASHNERLKLTGTRPEESAHDVTLRRNRQLREDGWNIISALSPAHDLVHESLALGAEPVTAMRLLLTAGLNHESAKEILREVLAAEHFAKCPSCGNRLAADMGPGHRCPHCGNELGELDLPEAHIAAAKETQGPTHAGVVLKAADTGRVLMLQRNLEDENDPAAGTWEFPGGGIEDGDETSLHAAIREWEEEVGQQFPQGGAVHHVWKSPKGNYHGHVVVIPEERQVELHHGRIVPNPDDPDGETAEQAAWWTVEHAKKNPALRPECKSSPWKEISKAGIGKEAASWDSLEEFDPGTTPPQHSLSQNPGSTGFATSEDPDSWEHLGETSSLAPSGVYAMLHDEPEPALPSTDGADDDLPIVDPRADMHSEIGMLDQSYTPSPVHGSLQEGSVADIVAQFQATAAAKSLATPGGESSEDVAQAAQEFLKKQALKDFNFHEQQELINEGALDNTMARNADVLKIEGTHYAALEEALAAEEALKDPDDLFA